MVLDSEARVEMETIRCRSLGGTDGGDGRHSLGRGRDFHCCSSRSRSSGSRGSGAPVQRRHYFRETEDGQCFSCSGHQEFANEAHHEDEELEPEDPAQPNVSELMARLSLW